MANGIKLGNDNISAFKVGSGDCKVYLGDTLLYPSTPPTFQGKWLATYNGGTTSSAECDASSAITQNEITPTNLVSVEIGDCVTSIDRNAFRGCTSLTSIDIPNGVISIGNSAFADCTSLTSIEIPSGVTSIGYQVFAGCYSLTSIDIPNGVTSIGESAFQYCSGLTSINIPSGVTSIGNQAFYNCSNLSSVVVHSTTPPTIGFWGTFDNTNNCPIYVPSASVNAYKSASGWSSYASRIQAIP